MASNEDGEEFAVLTDPSVARSAIRLDAPGSRFVLFRARCSPDQDDMMHPREC